MTARYFPDTDTLLVSFSDRRIVDTRDLNENTLAEFDEEGDAVSITVEHAAQQTDVSEFSYQRASTP
jgi:uncharacterized protein YuzE